MNIQRISGVNFGATRVLTASKGQYITDVYRLNRNDKNDVNFIKRCYATIAKRQYIPKISIRDFFHSFLKSDPRYDSKNYYIGIKDGEIISAGFSANINNDRARTSSTFYNNSMYSKLAKDCLTYSLLSEAQKVSPNTSVIDFPGLGSLLKEYHNAWLLPAEKIDSIKKQITEKYPEHVFDTSEEEVNLERMMGINQLEERILS